MTKFAVLYTLWAAMLAAPYASAAYTFPVYADSAQVDAACERTLNDLKQQEAGLQQQGADDGKAAVADTAGAVVLLAAMDAMTLRYEDTLGPMALLTPVHPDKAIRDATEACDLKYTAFNTAFLQNAAVYARLKQAQPTDAIDRRFQQDLLNAFEDSGVGLPAEQQKRALDISTESTRLSQEFERRIREDKTLVPFTQRELAGVPVAVWKNAKRDAQGRYLLGLDYPSSVPVIENAVSAAARERMWRALYNLGGADNLKLLSQLAALRREYAGLFGFASYADFVLRRRMAGTEAKVQDFLGVVKRVVTQRELTDLALLRAAKAQHLKQSLRATVVQRWDVAFYTERARRAKYAVDQEQLRAYFPPEASLQFVFRLAQQLFGVSLSPVAQTLWHPDARAFEVRDTASGNALGTLYVDLYPRADKFNHAAVWGFRGVSTLVGRLPAAGLVVNFNRQGLTLDELETLLHEFGHGVHSLLSQTRYASQAGTNVQNDFGEAPSQMLEDWVYDPQVMALFKQVCPACKPVPPALLAKAKRAKEFGKGVQVSRQQLLASYDLALHGKQPQDPMALWARMEGETPLGHVAGSMLPAGFAHIASGYAAGYYGYLWSLVLAEDLRTAFATDKLDAGVGRRYRETVLANGGQVAPEELLQQFLGRPSDSKAFFKALEKQ